MMGSQIGWEPLHILGAGSIGLLWAASIRSHLPTYPVTLLLRPHHQRRIQDHHVRINLQRGTTTTTPPPTTTTPTTTTTDATMSSLTSSATQTSIVHVPAQLIVDPSSSSSSSSSSTSAQQSNVQQSISNLLVTTKSYQAVSAIQSMLPWLNDTCRIILLCNGALSVQDEWSQRQSTVSLSSSSSSSS